jgi:micrococcal nuclease
VPKIHLRILLSCCLLVPVAVLLTVGTGRAEMCGGRAAQDVTVVSCYDGDTCTLNDKTKVRLVGIDAPEMNGTLGGTGQAGSEEAAMAIRSRLVGRDGVQMASHGTDRYGRTLGEFCVNGNSVNVEMIREGHAVMYRGKRQAKTINKTEFEAAQAQAKSEQKGIWSSGEAQDPGVYRRSIKHSNHKENDR